jgi:hypothetical protein
MTQATGNFTMYDGNGNKVGLSAFETEEAMKAEPASRIVKVNLEALKTKVIRHSIRATDNIEMYLEKAKEEGWGMLVEVGMRPDNSGKLTADMRQWADDDDGDSVEFLPLPDALAAATAGIEYDLYLSDHWYLIANATLTIGARGGITYTVTG